MIKELFFLIVFSERVCVTSCLILLPGLVLMQLSCAGKAGLSEGKLLLEPEYELSAVRFIEIDFQKVAFEISLRIDNPNYIPLNFSRVSYLLKLDNETVLNGMLSDGVNVPAKEQVQIFVPIEVQLSTLSMGAVNFMLNRKVSYHFELFLYPDIPILERKSFKRERSGILTF